MTYLQRRPGQEECCASRSLSGFYYLSQVDYDFCAIRAGGRKEIWTSCRSETLCATRAASDRSGIACEGLLPT
jgi:hypothetical protein